MSLLDEARKGRLDGLRALRDKLAGELDECESSRDVASLSLRLMDVLEQIADLSGGKSAKPAGEPRSSVDEFTARRRKREGA